MSDIFKMIRGMSNTERPARRKNSLSEQLDKISDDDLDLNIGEVKMSNPNLIEFETINFKELNAMSDKKKVQILTKEYLEVVDRYNFTKEKLDKTSKELTSINISTHQYKQSIDELRELIREIGKMIPEGIELKRKLEELDWTAESVKDTLLTKVSEMVQRAENANEVAEARMTEIITENTQLKKLILHTENERASIQEKYDALLNHLNNNEDSSINMEELQNVVDNAAKGNTPVPLPEEPKETIEEKNPEQNDVSIDEPSNNDSKFAQYDAEIDDSPVDVDTHILLDVERHLEFLNEQKKYILEIIGRTGICRKKELEEFLADDVKGTEYFKKNNTQELAVIIKSLKDSGYLDSTKVDLGSKGGYNFSVFELSKLGESIYKVITKRNPHEPESKKIMAQHKTLEHGYLIKETAVELEKKGYTVYQDRKDLRFDLPEGKRKDFDLIAEKNGEKIYIEVERGTHTDEDFFNAMDKIYKVMTETLGQNPAHFHIVSPNKKLLMNKTKKQFFLWIKKRLGGFDEAKGKIFAHFTTFDDLKKVGDRVWEDKKM